jgi:phage head maturation protease
MTDTEQPDTEQQPGGVQRPIEIRSSTEIAEVDSRQRIITLLTVPYERWAKVEYRGEVWDEVFSRTAFDGIEKRPQRVRVNREHLRGDTVGKAVAFYPDRPEGLVSEVRISKTLRGDDTLALAEDDCLSSSVGFGVLPSNQVLDRRLMQRRINTAWLDHIALVESPAYEGADVLNVRDAPAPAGSGVPLLTPVLDDFLTDPLIRRALGLEPLST